MDSFISWIGGKKRLRHQILSRFPETEISRYIEVFGGAGWVLFAKERTAKQMEVFNDINGELVNLYRCVKYHCQELQKELEWTIDAREQFFDAKDQLDIRGFTDIQRAARYYQLLKTSFGSDYRTFATAGKRLHVEKLSAVQSRLEGVVIEHKDFENLIKVYDREKALFYLDPPYVGTEKYYDTGFGEKDHQRLRDCLGKIKGRFILSYNDDIYVRELYAGYNIERLTRKCTLAATGNSRDFPELLIKNF